MTIMVRRQKTRFTEAVGYSDPIGSVNRVKISYAPDLQSSPYEIAAALHDEEYFVFLDSSATDGSQGRYSVLAWRPRAVLRVKDENPFPAIDRLLRSAAKSAVI